MVDPVDRINTTPTLIRTFYQRDVHHTELEFTRDLPSQEVYIYTWKDATLREISTAFLKSSKLNFVKSLDFCLLIPNLEKGFWDIEHIGKFDLTEDKDELYTLESYGYKPGYMMDVAYTLNER